MSYAVLTCAKCRHAADFDAFTRTPVAGDLPAGTYQCPACRHAWRMESQGKGRLYRSGLFVPPARKAVPIASML